MTQAKVFLATINKIWGNNFDNRCDNADEDLISRAWDSCENAENALQVLVLLPHEATTHAIANGEAWQKQVFPDQSHLWINTRGCAITEEFPA